jgi:N-dimethylarginine dimethylaminohydrolase
MKVDFSGPHTGGGANISGGLARSASRWGITSESDRLTDVLLVSPDHLAPVACCSVTRENLRDGYRTDRCRARSQHEALIEALGLADVRIELAAGSPDLPDMVYARDAGLMTPWGYLPLAPGAPHRRREACLLADHVRSLGIPVLPQVEGGTIEGGDISIFRDGLALIGCSGERTDEAGAKAAADLFAHHGWRALIYRFDPHFLHLDTQFSALSFDQALACVDVLDDAFLSELKAEAIDLMPVSYKAARRLGCNVLALGDDRILAATGAGLSEPLQREGYQVTELDLSEFTNCGGGVHCLTLPLARR